MPAAQDRGMHRHRQDQCSPHASARRKWRRCDRGDHGDGNLNQRGRTKKRRDRDATICRTPVLSPLASNRCKNPYDKRAIIARFSCRSPRLRNAMHKLKRLNRAVISLSMSTLSGMVPTAAFAGGYQTLDTVEVIGK